jgi:hypothetical protein
MRELHQVPLGDPAKEFLPLQPSQLPETVAGWI